MDSPNKAFEGIKGFGNTDPSGNKNYYGLQRRTLNHKDTRKVN